MMNEDGMSILKVHLVALGLGCEQEDLTVQAINPASLSDVPPALSRVMHIVDDDDDDTSC